MQHNIFNRDGLNWNPETLGSTSITAQDHLRVLERYNFQSKFLISLPAIYANKAFSAENQSQNAKQLPKKQKLHQFKKITIWNTTPDAFAFNWKSSLQNKSPESYKVLSM